MATCTHVHHLFSDVADLLYGISHHENVCMSLVLLSGSLLGLFCASKVVYRVRLLGADALDDKGYLPLERAGQFPRGRTGGHSTQKINF